jgi:repressor LexA
VVKEDAELFALQVQGESMIDAMINDGDIVVMKPHPNPSNGDLVAVWLEDKEETTLKRFYLEGGKVRLQPENSTMQPIIIDDPSTVRIQGRVVAVVRQVN